MASIIPTDSSIAQSQQRVTLGSTVYIFTLKYNAREDNWHFDLALDDGTLLAAGVRIVCQLPLLFRYIDSRLPAGVIVALSNGSDDSEPRWQELDEEARVTLWYFEPGELTQ